MDNTRITREWIDARDIDSYIFWRTTETDRTKKDDNRNKRKKGQEKIRPRREYENFLKNLKKELMELSSFQSIVKEYQLDYWNEDRLMEFAKTNIHLKEINEGGEIFRTRLENYFKRNLVDKENTMDKYLRDLTIGFMTYLISSKYLTENKLECEHGCDDKVILRRSYGLRGEHETLFPGYNSNEDKFVCVSPIELAHEISKLLKEMIQVVREYDLRYNIKTYYFPNQSFPPLKVGKNVKAPIKVRLRWKHEMLGAYHSIKHFFCEYIRYMEWINVALAGAVWSSIPSKSFEEGLKGTFCFSPANREKVEGNSHFEDALNLASEMSEDKREMLHTLKQKEWKLDFEIAETIRVNDQEIVEIVLETCFPL